MKKIVSAGLMLATMSGAAVAADLPARIAPPPPPPLPVFTWTGAYFGINAGYAFDAHGRFRALSGNTGNTSQVGFARPALFNNDSDGFSGGGQIGYNYQLGGLGGPGGAFGLGGAGIVVGFEADAAYTDLTSTRTVTGIGAGPVNGGLLFANRYRTSMDFLGTVRGRLGLAFNQFLIYGTGGFAYGDVFDSVTYFNTPTVNGGSPRFLGSRSRIETGYAYGGGVEYALPTNSFLNFFKSSAVTLKVEYLRYDLGTQTINLPRVAGGGASAGSFYQDKVNTEGNIIRAGLNYKFGSY